MSWNCILERVAETKSTNDDLLARWRAGELTTPVARIAHKQTAGKGRAGRSWLANPLDTICFSLAYPFHRSPAELSGLSLVIGLAVIAGIAAALDLSEGDLYAQGLRLKWPNDLLLNNAKLGGILIEGGQAKPGVLTWMIIGVGINLQNAHAIEENLGNEANVKVSALNQLISDQIALPDIEYVWLKLIESFEKYLTEFDRYGFSYFQHAWVRWDALQGQPVCISGGGKEPIFGSLEGVDKTGALLLRQGVKIITVHAGDVSIRVQ